MAFKILFACVATLYIIINICNNHNNSNGYGYIPTSRSLHTNCSKKQFYNSVRRKRRCTRKESYKNTTAIVLIRLLLLSGDIELNPEPITCIRCHQVFKHQKKFDQHIANQELISCRFCMQDFCRSDRCHRHERACPRQPTSKTSTTPTAPGQWKCNHCNQIFKEHSRYQSYITNQELISCRFCMQDFCRTDWHHRHERTCPSQPTSTTSISPTVPGQWKCNRCNQNLVRRRVSQKFWKIGYSLRTAEWSKKTRSIP